MVKIHYLKPNDKIQPYVAGVCGGLENFSVSDISILVNNNNPPDYVSFDGKGIDLEDYSKKFYESGDYAGFVSSNVSDGDMVVASELNISLSGSVGEFSLDGGISFHFYGDCCREIYVQYRNKDTEVFYEEILEVNSEVFVLKTDGFGDYCVGLTVMFTKTALPNQFIKLSYVKFGTVTVFDKPKSINLLEEINVLSDDLPMNQLEYNVATNTEIDFKENDLMYVFSNGKYYGTFYLDNAERVSKGIYSVKAYNSVSILDNEEYAEWFYYENNTSAVFADKIREKTGVSLIFPDTNYEFDGAIPIESCRKALCKCAFAVQLMADGSRNDGIRLKPIPKTVSSTILTADKRIIGESSFNKEKCKTSAKVKFSEYALTSDSKTVTLKYAKGKTVTYYFDEPSVLANYSQDEIEVKVQTSNYFIFTAKSSTQTIVISKLNFRCDEETIRNPLASTNKTKSEIDLSELCLAGYRVNDSQYISLVESKKKDILKYMQSSGTVKAKIRLRGERVGDLIRIETAYDGIKTGIITSMNISFGYEDVAEIEVLEWNL